MVEPGEYRLLKLIVVGLSQRRTIIIQQHPVVDLAGVQRKTVYFVLIGIGVPPKLLFEVGDLLVDGLELRFGLILRVLYDPIFAGEGAVTNAVLAVGALFLADCAGTILSRRLHSGDTRALLLKRAQLRAEVFELSPIL